MVVCTRAKQENGKKKGTGEQKPPSVPGDSASERDSVVCKQKGQWSVQAEEATRCANKNRQCHHGIGGTLPAQSKIMPTRKEKCRVRSGSARCSRRAD